jgi:hypothetical protein
MFVTKLFNFSKAGCLLLCGFIVAFIYFNYKWGAVATPATAYGMYSTKLQLNDTLNFYQLTANGAPISNIEFLNFAQVDFTQIYPQRFERAQQQNFYCFKTLSPFFVGLLKAENYNCNTNSLKFEKWYNNKLAPFILQKQNGVVGYKKLQCVFSNGTLKIVN